MSLILEHFVRVVFLKTVPPHYDSIKYSLEELHHFFTQVVAYLKLWKMVSDKVSEIKENLLETIKQKNKHSVNKTLSQEQNFDLLYQVNDAESEIRKGIAMLIDCVCNAAIDRRALPIVAPSLLTALKKLGDQPSLP